LILLDNSALGAIHTAKHRWSRF